MKILILDVMYWNLIIASVFHTIYAHGGFFIQYILELVSEVENCEKCTCLLNSTVLHSIEKYNRNGNIDYLVWASSLNQWKVNEFHFIKYWKSSAARSLNIHKHTQLLMSHVILVKSFKSKSTECRIPMFEHLTVYIWSIEHLFNF